MSSAALTHPAVDAVLSTAARLLGTEVVFVGGLTEDAFTFERVRGGHDWPGVHQGATTHRADSLCQQLLSGAPPAVSDVPHDPHYSAAAARGGLGITSYVGVPVRGGDGGVVATLCGIDRARVEVSDQVVQVLGELAQVVAAHLGPAGQGQLVIRRLAAGWQVDDGGTTGAAEDDLTSAMVLADLLATEAPTAPRPRRPEQHLDELEQLRLSVRQLEHALAARVTVEQAIGVLTERQHQAPRQAFERLRKVARSRGRRVHDLAREVVASAGDPAVPLPPELAGRH